MKLKKRLQAVLLAGMMALSATAAAIPSFTTISAQAEDTTNNDDWLHAVGSRLYDKDGNEVLADGCKLVRLQLRRKLLALSVER